MKQILVISGKGGTGKTSFTAAFASLSVNSIFCDCDVDAADLYLILKPTIIEEKAFISGHKASIDSDKCISCGKCYELCRFQAVDNSDKYSIKDIFCEGCAVCVWNCPSKAISLNDSYSGKSFISDTRFGKMSHAKLLPGAENSGKLVSVVRQNAYELAKVNNAQFIIIDGPPGIGCPVIASMTGVNLIIIVTEPSLSGLSDMERVIELSNQFGITVKVCINKSDINDRICNIIEEKLTGKGIEILGKIPYDKNFKSALIEGKAITEYTDNSSSRELISIWNKIIKSL